MDHRQGIVLLVNLPEGVTTTNANVDSIENVNPIGERTHSPNARLLSQIPMLNANGLKLEGALTGCQQAKGCGHKP